MSYPNFKMDQYLGLESEAKNWLLRYTWTTVAIMSFNVFEVALMAMIRPIPPTYLAVYMLVGAVYFTLLLIVCQIPPKARYHNYIAWMSHLFGFIICAVPILLVFVGIIGWIVISVWIIGFASVIVVKWRCSETTTDAVHSSLDANVSGDTQGAHLEMA